MQNDEIFLLIATEQSDTLTADERQRLEQWKAADVRNAETYDHLVRIWHATPDAASLAVYDKQKAYLLFAKRIAEQSLAGVAETGSDLLPQATTETEPTKRPTAEVRRMPIRRRMLRFLRYAAVVVLVVCACSYLFYRLGQHEIENTFAQIVTEAPEGSTSKVILPDGTAVWLNAGSRIAYSQGFGVKERRLMLTGEGYFEVYKNREMPFLVQSGSLTVRVTGTKFDFRDYPSDRTATVSLDEGSVALALTGKEQEGEYRLKPNQRVVLDKRSGNLSLEDYTDNSARLWTDGTIMLNGRRLADIAADLERTYATHITIAGSTLADTRFYGVFHRKDQSLQQILNVLAGTGRIRYTIQGNSVKIY